MTQAVEKYSGLCLDGPHDGKRKEAALARPVDAGMSKTEFFFFGCLNGPGHFLHPSDGSPRRYYDDQPFKGLDGSLQPLTDGKQVEGPALLHHKDGWSVVSFWDRSVDTRGGSNGNFLVNKTLSFDQIMAMAQAHFPQILARFKFDIADVTPSLAPGKDEG